MITFVIKTFPKLTDRFKIRKILRSKKINGTVGKWWCHYFDVGVLHVTVLKLLNLIKNRRNICCSICLYIRVNSWWDSESRILCPFDHELLISDSHFHSRMFSLVRQVVRLLIYFQQTKHTYILVYLHTRYLSARHLPRSSTIACISAGAGVVHDCLN